MEIRQITKAEADDIIATREPRGLFYLDTGESFVGIDNRTGHAWTEEFDSLPGCRAWLLLPVQPDREQTKWFCIVRWCAEDVIAAAEKNGIVLTEAQAEKWLEKNERWFREALTEYGNEVLASASRESFEEVCKA